MNRRRLLSLLALGAPCAFAPSRAFAASSDDVSDPANASGAPALRVLLGTGTAAEIDAHSFMFGGRRYRGSFSYTDFGQVVSTVPLEQYLYSVISREMPRAWPAAALQAQAIVARTYVLKRSTPLRDYDLVPSQADQVYTGVDAEHPQTNAAVDATSGRVLRFGRGFAQVVYSSCCGGHTEASSLAWDGPPVQYLSGVACGYCASSPWFTWTQSIALSKLQDALGQQLAGLRDLRSVSLAALDASGRARFWEFQGSSGTQRIKAADVRRALGTRALPSLLVHRMQLTNVPAQPALVVEGAGLGHGVGLCQWGARGLAITGADASQILDFYFPGTAIGTD